MTGKRNIQRGTSSRQKKNSVPGQAAEIVDPALPALDAIIENLREQQGEVVNVGDVVDAGDLVNVGEIVDAGEAVNVGDVVDAGIPGEDQNVGGEGIGMERINGMAGNNGMAGMILVSADEVARLRRSLHVSAEMQSELRRLDLPSHFKLENENYLSEVEKFVEVELGKELKKKEDEEKKVTDHGNQMKQLKDELEKSKINLQETKEKFRRLQTSSNQAKDENAFLHSQVANRFNRDAVKGATSVRDLEFLHEEDLEQRHRLIDHVTLLGELSRRLLKSTGKSITFSKGIERVDIKENTDL